MFTGEIGWEPLLAPYPAGPEPFWNISRCCFSKNCMYSWGD